MFKKPRRVVITGVGIVSCLGNDKSTVSHALKNGLSGITAQPTFSEMGLRSQIGGRPEIDLKAQIDRKLFRFMGDAAGYAYVATQQAIADAGLTPEQVSSPMTGLLAGSGGASSEHQVDAADLLREKGVKRVGPYMVPRTMASTVSACLATSFKIKGLNYSISSACATSAHCIGHGYEQIQLGKQDIVFAGGGEELHWSLASMFDAMGALSSKFNDQPTTASRPYDQQRDGFVIAGGAGMVVLESLESAQARGAHIYAEVTGFGATSDGADMVAPSGEGAIRCMQMALQGDIEGIDYVNTHGTSTPVGDTTELASVKAVFGDHKPYLSSTKSLSGHSLGAAGVHEAIYSILMLQDEFVAGSINVETPVEEVEDMNLVTKSVKGVKLNAILSNSFGFGGTNACLVLKRYQD